MARKRLKEDRLLFQEQGVEPSYFYFSVLLGSLERSWYYLENKKEMMHLYKGTLGSCAKAQDLLDICGLLWKYLSNILLCEKSRCRMLQECHHLCKSMYPYVCS